MNHPATHSMYYLAILCPQEIDKQVLAYKRWMKDRFGSVAALKSPAHITLIPPFWLDQESEPELQQMVKSFVSDIGELQIQLSGFSHFNDNVLFIVVTGNKAIEELKNQVENYFMQYWPGIIKKDERPFHPHVTIATRDVKPSDFIKAWEHFSKIAYTETFITQTISLLKLSDGKWNMIGQKVW